MVTSPCNATAQRPSSKQRGHKVAAFGDCLPAQEVVELLDETASVPALLAASLLERLKLPQQTQRHARGY